MRGCSWSSGLAAALLFAWGACSKREPPPPPSPAPVITAAAVEASRPKAEEELDVILLTVDCLRADMPWAGYARPIAPRMTELAKRAVIYTNAYSASSYTSMSMGGLLASRYPGELDRDGYFFGSYGDKNVFFPELLQKVGVRTLAAHAHGYFKGTGLDQGFDQWELVPDLKWNNQTDENITSPKLEAIAEKLLSDSSLDQKRFFAWFHFVDPHDGYMTHEGIAWNDNKTLRDRYDGEITYTDQYIGKLLDFVAARPYGRRVAWVLTGDHGESFGEHKRYNHGFELWQNLVRVPLVFVLPDAQPRTIDATRSALDVAPTILELMKAPADPSFRGKSLVPELRGARAEPRDVIVDLPQTSDNERRRALISGAKKIIAYGPTEYSVAYDLEADPDENKPLVSGPLYDEMRARYQDAVKDIKDVPPTRCREGCLAGAYGKDGG